MPEFVSDFFSGNFQPHGYCLLWRPELVWTHVISDALIAGAYFSIPIALVTFLRRRPDVEFGGMFWLFALFILSCGLTHVMGIWNLWHGDYALEATIKAITAAASVPTAILLWPLIPRALAIPSPSMLQRKNDELAAALAERDAALDRLQAEIAQRERAEAALVHANKMEAVGQLTGGIAHDFNNLLQAISGNLELIQMVPGDEAKVTRWAGNAAQAAERGTKLTGQLLTFSRQQRLEARPVNVAPLLTGMEDLLRNSVGPTVGLRIEVDGDVGAVSSDPTQLELAILNCAINGRDAMPSGGTLIIRAEHEGERVAIRVIDHGVGMSADVAQRALEPFFTTKGPGQGTGLGLSMAYGVALAAGGELSIDSRIGEGTVVTFLLPKVAESEDRKDETSGQSGATQQRTAEILLVDDDASVRSTVADMLRSRGHSVIEVSDGPQALLQLERSAVDVMLLDFAMPGMNGAEVASHALGLRPGLRLLFLSGFSDSEAIDRAVKGRARVLRKPITADELARAVNELID
ncbi:response regulator [Sphingomonas astaxanthinifaciens]|uniref:histidine kinase n=1 Tax=Sphingomonas astaxanthinifaciens DSM 22298 TaxID=1123267 RepID=A0ABQ5Z439_9SPHN|nr:response regulator [Sphingomonas astaxanthinifaciens]GLR47560.1 hypothetical protein GCM10007925_12720 [Sphingomonas astaxanthinifaciens DSM 22298]